jgi:hypothetical protein
MRRKPPPERRPSGDRRDTHPLPLPRSLPSGVRPGETMAEFGARHGYGVRIDGGVAGWTGTLRTPETLQVAAAQREANAMVTISAALALLTDQERRRVLAWAYAHADEHQPGAVPDLPDSGAVRDDAGTPEGGTIRS